MGYEIVKSLHIIFMVTWFAGLFYLPRLFVYHAMSSDEVSIERFSVMERKLYYGWVVVGTLATIAAADRYVKGLASGMRRKAATFASRASSRIRRTRAPATPG